jgi:hypothetical protein
MQVSGEGRCGCWCLVADAFQRYLGMDFDAAAQMASDLWDQEADKERVWSARYADDHDVETYPNPAPCTGDISYDEDSEWCQEHGHTGLLRGCVICDKLIATKPRFARYLAVREEDWRMYPHDEECPRCGRRQWAGEFTQETCQACGYVSCDDL